MAQTLEQHVLRQVFYLKIEQAKLKAQLAEVEQRLRVLGQIDADPPHPRKCSSPHSPTLELVTA